jgi:hypothetical protein
MRINKDDQSEDPQSTLRPRLSEQNRTTETRGRKLILGTPRMTSGAPQVEMDSAMHRGFTLTGRATKNASASTSKAGVQPWILMVAAGAMVLLVVALLLRPSTGSSAEALANERLVSQYTKYLETKQAANGVDVAERRKDVVARLQAVAWAKAVGDKKALENELTTLMFLDNDKSSPLYQYSVTQLKLLGPPKKRAGSI